MDNVKYVQLRLNMDNPTDRAVYDTLHNLPPYTKQAGFIKASILAYNPSDMNVTSAGASETFAKMVLERLDRLGSGITGDTEKKNKEQEAEAGKKPQQPKKKASTTGERKDAIRDKTAKQEEDTSDDDFKPVSTNPNAKLDKDKMSELLDFLDS